MKSRNWTPITSCKVQLDKGNKNTTATRFLRASDALRITYLEDEELNAFCALDREDWVMTAKKEAGDAATR